MLGDVHIYENHINQANEQLSRKPYELPNIKISKIMTVEGEQKPFDIFNWTHENYCLYHYKHHPHIKMDVSI